MAVQFSSLRSYTLVVTTTSRYLSFMNCFCVWNVLFIVSLFCCRLCIGKPLTCMYYLTEITVTEIITAATLQKSPTFSWLVWFVGQQVPPPFSWVPFLPLAPLSPGYDQGLAGILASPSCIRSPVALSLLPFGLVRVCVDPYLCAVLLRFLAVELCQMPL